MNFREIAISLIQAIEGLETEKNIEGVLEVFDGIKNGVNNLWEDHLANETTEALMYDNVLCPCGRLIEITRDVGRIGVKGV